MITSKFMAAFVENSLNNLGYVGFKFPGHHITGHRNACGGTRWTDNQRLITEEEAHRLIQKRFTT